MPKRRNPGAKRNPAASRSMKARTTRSTRRSPDRMSERGPYVPQRRIANQKRHGYNTMAYGKPDVASLGDPRTTSRWHGDVGPTSHKAQAFQPSPDWRGGRGDFGRSDVPKRSMAVGGPRPDSWSGKHRRKTSTESALRRADASMFNYDD